MYVGLQVKCMLFLSDLTKPKFSRQVLISVSHYKISRKFVLREPSCSIRVGGWTDKQDRNNSCYTQICERSRTQRLTKGAALFLKQMILIIVLRE